MRRDRQAEMVLSGKGSFHVTEYSIYLFGSSEVEPSASNGPFLMFHIKSQWMIESEKNTFYLIKFQQMPQTSN